MTPIERVRRKSQALSKLGITGMPNEAELKQAYKRMVMARHPDRGEGSSAEIAEINNAYQFLLDECEHAVDQLRRHAPRPTSMQRPTAPTRETVFDVETVVACKNLQEWDERRCEARHVAVRMRQSGRDLTYVAPTALKRGLNIIALPAADLSQHNKTLNPVLVTVRAGDDQDNVASLPTSLRNRLFPGARQVRIEFVEN